MAIRMTTYFLVILLMKCVYSENYLLSELPLNSIFYTYLLESLALSQTHQWRYNKENFLSRIFLMSL